MASRSPAVSDAFVDLVLERKEDIMISHNHMNRDLETKWNPGDRSSTDKTLDYG
jgi:hypothetical protein